MNVYQVRWRPGSDQLLGICHCGAERVAEDPIALWAWLHAHPDGHAGRADATAVPDPVEPVAELASA